MNKSNIKCRKCDWPLHYVDPNPSMSHCGSDYWTKSGERRWKPTICMACRTKVGRHAKREQDRQNEEDIVQRMENVLNNLLQGL